MLRLIPAAKLYDVWGWVRNGLVDCAGKTQERWLPEDVYLSIKNGNAFLYAIEHSGDEIGFTVLCQHNDSSGPTLFVWVMWVEPGAGVPLQDKINQALDDKAREIGSKRVRMQSPLKGWQRNKYWRAVSAPVR